MEYWQNRVHPFLKKIWPKSSVIKSKGISESFARLCIASDDAFPEALTELRFWLQPVQHPDYVIHRLYEAKLSERYPKDALNFLNTIVSGDAQWVPRELEQCLDKIREANTQLENDSYFIRLQEVIRRGGIV